MIAGVETVRTFLAAALLLLSASGLSAQAYVQGNTFPGDFGDGGPRRIPFNAPNTAGNTIVVTFLLSWGEQITVRDERGNPYSVTRRDIGQGVASVELIWVSSGISAGPNTVIIEGVPSGSYHRGTIGEYSGALKVFQSRFFTGTGSSVSGSVVAAQAGDLVLAHVLGQAPGISPTWFSVRYVNHSIELTADGLAPSAGEIMVSATNTGGKADLQLVSLTASDSPPPPPSVDVCPNIPGEQVEVPPGMTKDASGNCVTTAPPSTGGVGGLASTIRTASSDPVSCLPGSELRAQEWYFNIGSRRVRYCSKKDTWEDYRDPATPPPPPGGTSSGPEPLASTFPGVDPGAKISSAIASCPTNGCQVVADFPGFGQGVGSKIIIPAGTWVKAPVGARYECSTGASACFEIHQGGHLSGNGAHLTSGENGIGTAILGRGMTARAVVHFRGSNSAAFGNSIHWASGEQFEVQAWDGSRVGACVEVDNPGEVFSLRQIIVQLCGNPDANGVSPGSGVKLFGMLAGSWKVDGVSSFGNLYGFDVDGATSLGEFGRIKGDGNRTFLRVHPRPMGGGVALKFGMVSWEAPTCSVAEGCGPQVLVDTSSSEATLVFDILAGDCPPGQSLIQAKAPMNVTVARIFVGQNCANIVDDEFNGKKLPNPMFGKYPGYEQSNFIYDPFRGIDGRPNPTTSGAAFELIRLSTAGPVPYSGGAQVTTYLVSGGAAGVSLSLPGVGTTAPGRLLIFKKVDETAGVVRITAAGGKLIDGLSEYRLTNLNQSVALTPDGVGWAVVFGN